MIGGLQIVQELQAWWEPPFQAVVGIILGQALAQLAWTSLIGFCLTHATELRVQNIASRKAAAKYVS